MEGEVDVRAEVEGEVVAAVAAYGVARGGREIAAIVRPTMTAMVWLALGPLAYVIANGPAERDRREGLDRMVRASGVNDVQLAMGRTIAAGLESVRVVGLPSLLLVAAIFVQNPGAQASALGAGVMGFSLVVGISVGVMADACGRLAGARGPGLFALLVLAPWMLSGRLGDLVSLPTLFEQLLAYWVGA